MYSSPDARADRGASGGESGADGVGVGEAKEGAEAVAFPLSSFEALDVSLSMSFEARQQPLEAKGAEERAKQIVAFPVSSFKAVDSSSFEARHKRPDATLVVAAECTRAGRTRSNDDERWGGRAGGAGDR